LAELIKSDPERAIALSLPAQIRGRLPSAVSQELESRVSGIGEFSVTQAMPTIDGPPVKGIERAVKLGEHEYSCFVYGRRANQTTKLGIPLHGVAIDGKLALADSSHRELESGEVPDSKRKIVDLTSKTKATEPVLGQVGKTFYRFANHEQLMRAESKLESAETGLGPYPKR